tara:strand:+ start:866 stop:1357 length:492 start_codon:yes stop_codon:yes gene_type:complete
MDAGIAIGANVVSALIGRQILSQAISDASGTIYSSLGDIFYYSANVDKVLCELDIANKLITMELLIKELNSHSDCFDEESIHTCLENLHDMIMHIREDLKQIKEQIEKHKTKYLSKYRSVDVKFQIYNLKLHSKLLLDRYDLLIKTIELTSLVRNNTKLVKNV